MAKRTQSYNRQLTKSLKRGAHWCCRFWRKSRWNKIAVVVIAVAVIAVGTMYGIAQWYIRGQANRPLEQGVSFIPDYASSLGLSPQKTMDALLGINVRHFRLVSYWSDMEPQPGHYDFTQLDWEFKKAEQAHAKVILTLGLRQPRCRPIWSISAAILNHDG